LPILENTSCWKTSGDRYHLGFVKTLKIMREDRHFAGFLLEDLLGTSLTTHQLLTTRNKTLRKGHLLPYPAFSHEEMIGPPPAQSSLFILAWGFPKTCFTCRKKAMTDTLPGSPS